MLSRQEFASRSAERRARSGRRVLRSGPCASIRSSAGPTPGIVVRAGDTVTLDASGTIQMSDDAKDTATPAGSTTGRRAPDAPVLNQLAGGLLAQIDNYGPIFVGGRRTFTAPVSGRLYFGVNDDHLADNRGEFVVNVSVAPR